MKKLILSITIIFATNCFGSAGDGSSGITSAGDGSSGITSAGDGSSGITSAGDGSSGITNISNRQFMQLNNGLTRNCLQMQNNTMACVISRR